MKGVSNVVKVLLLTWGVFSSFGNPAWATNNAGRLGVGLTNQLVNEIPAVSLKLQRTQTFAFGAVLALDTDDSNGGMGAGLKFYRLLFDEPQLNFYASFLGAYIKKKTENESNSGYQLDFTLGSEFHFTGLDSIGFSFEFGMSVNKLEDSMRLQTLGNHLIKAAVHFYI